MGREQGTAAARTARHFLRRRKSLTTQTRTYKVSCPLRTAKAGTALLSSSSSHPPHSWVWRVTRIWELSSEVCTSASHH